MELQRKLYGCEEYILRDRKKQKWKYISNRKMEELYPNGGFLILADLKRGRKKDSIGCLTDGEENGQSTELYSYAAKLKSYETCIGYIGVEKQGGSADAFVRIVKKSGWKRYRLLWLFLLLLLLLAGGAYYFLGRKEVPNLDRNAISYHVEGMENRDPDQISIPILSQIKVNEKDMTAKVNLANPEGNPCYFEYYLILDDGEEEIYKSGLIEPGTAIPEFTLNRELKAGTYQATVKIRSYNLKDYEKEMNGGALDVKVIVGEE